MGSVISRRETGRVALGGVLAVAWAATRVDEAESKKKCRKLFAPCTRSKQCCGSDKKNLQCRPNVLCSMSKYCCKPAGKPCGGDDCACCQGLVCSGETNRCVVDMV
jgi:hypothetical protein